MKKIRVSGKIIITYVVMSVLIGIGMIYAQKDNNVYPVDNLNEKWDVMVKNDIYKDVDITQFKIDDELTDTRVTAVKKLDSSNIQYPCLEINTSDYCMDIFIGNKKIADNYIKKQDSYIANKRNFYINLPNNFDGKELKLVIYVQNNSSNMLMENINITSENNYVYKVFRENLMKYIMGALVISIGLLLFMGALMIYDGTYIVKRLFWTGLGFIAIGLVLYAKFDILELYMLNNMITKAMEYIGVYLCMVCVLMMSYVGITGIKLKRYIKIYSIIVLFFCLIVIIFNNMGIMLYSELSYFDDAFMYIAAILSIIASYSNLNNINVSEKIYSRGMLVNSLLSTVGLIGGGILEKLHISEYDKYLIIVMVVLYFIVSMIFFANYLKEYIQRATNDKILATIAYTDHLTGLMNRTKYDAFINELGEKLNEIFVVISFDLNNLKKINDNEGHEAGDEYIKTFAKSLNGVFGEADYIGRIGGDEFVVMENEKNKELDKKIKKLENVFIENMKKNKCEFEASFAYGYAKVKDEKINNIGELIKIADDRMYEYKKKQKVIRC